MSSVGIKDLKNRLTEYIRRTKGGEEIVVTERGRPVAVLVPIRAARELESVEARLARLAARGLVTLPARKPLSRVRLARTGRPISDTVIEDRR